MASSSTSGANPSYFNSVDKWIYNYTYEDVIHYFGIVDRNENVQPIPSRTLNVFSTNLFIPMELDKSEKLFLYLTGFIKLVELFRDRTRELQTERDQWMLYIYCDNMFFEEGGFKNDVYKKREGNNKNNIKIKGNYGTNKEFFKRLLQLYREYLAIIIANEGGKYSFVKLFSYNCLDVKSENIKKRNPYLGHPSTFGSLVRFISFFDDTISRVFSINIRTAITPKLVYLIKKWIQSGQNLITNNYYGYDFRDFSDISYNNNSNVRQILKEIFKNNIKRKPLKPSQFNNINNRHAAGLIGFYKKKKHSSSFVSQFSIKSNSQEFPEGININIFMNIMRVLIKLHIKKLKYKPPYKDEITLNFFSYGIDEVLLNYIINLSVEEVYYFSENKSIFEILDYDIVHKNRKEIDQSNFPALLEKLKEFVSTLKTTDIYKYFQFRINNTKSTNPLKLSYFSIIITLKEEELTDEEIKLINHNLKILEDLYLFYGINNFLFYKLVQVNEEYLDSDYLKKINLYDLKSFFEFLNNKIIIDLQLGRYFTDFIEETEKIKNYFSNVESYSFTELLCGFDEIKPLYIVEKNDENLEKFFTYFDFKMEELIQALISYYTNGDLVLKVPYVIDEQQLSVPNGKQPMMLAASNQANTSALQANTSALQFAGGKNKKKTKKPKKKLKSNKTKKLIKNKS